MAALPFFMARLRAALVLVGTLATPAPGAADEIYALVDGGGVVHYTNVPHDRRYHRVAEEGIAHVANTPRDRCDQQTERPGGSREGVHRIAGASRAGRAAGPRPSRTAAFDAHIRSAAQKYGLAPPLLKAVLAAESNFDPAAVSGKGARGLMQLMPETAREMCVSDILDPVQNIEGGARYLRQLQDQFGADLERVLAAYNAGPDRVSRSGAAVPAIPETQAYVSKVLRLYEAYAKGE
jgi:hypothetical protein